MKTVKLIQGTKEWHEHRAAHFNASDAPSMMGCSPYKTRAQLLREVATGITPEVDSATQRIFDAGHRFEALARPLAEDVVGQEPDVADRELFPVTGTNGNLSASFDGLTLDGDIAFEHKTLNESLRNLVWLDDGSHLPLHYRVQMEHQLMVSGAEKCLFMASQWDAEGSLIEERHCWYRSDAALRDKIAAGWAQFAADVAAYQPEPAAAPAVVAEAVEGFGALSLHVEGRVLASNLDAFKAGAEAFIARLPKPEELQDDQDFANAEQAVKACADAESRIRAAKDAVLAQMADVDSILRTADGIHDSIRAARLALDKVVKSEKESRKAGIVQAGVAEVMAHIAGINASLGQHAIGVAASLTSEIGASIKGKKSLASMRDAVAGAVAEQKIAASQQADKVRGCIAVLAQFEAHGHLLADRVQLCASKAPEDLRNLVKLRIAEHERREAARLEAERARIRQEEAERLAAERAERERLQRMTAAQLQAEIDRPRPAPAAELSPAAQAANEAEGAARFQQRHPSLAVAPQAAATGRVTLGEINAAIAPLTVTAAGLSQFGFEPVGTERAAKLYAASDFGPICAAMIASLEAAAGRGIRGRAA